MKTAWHDVWSSGRGPVGRLTPQARLICGLLVVLACLFAASTTWSGAGAALGITLLWTLLTLPPGKVLLSTVLLGLILFLPYLLLAPIIRWEDPAMSWSQAFEAPWSVVLHGMTSMVVTVSTATTLSPSSLRQGLSRLPVPAVVSAVLIQIVHQTFNLICETRRLAAAVAVRGGTKGIRTGLRLAGSLPTIWMPRIMDRADRVAAAMELRGYTERSVDVLGADRSTSRDYLAVIATLLTSSGAILLRLLGTP